MTTMETAATEPPPRPRVADILDALHEATHRDELSVGDLVSAGDYTTFLTAMMVPALLVVSPLSGIPLFSSICGISIALIALQMLMRRTHLWLPDFIRRRRLDPARTRAALSWLRKVADFFDHNSRERLGILVRQPFAAIVQVLPIFAGLSMPFLEALPFSSSLLGAAVLCFCVGLLVRDGLFVLFGLVLMSVAASIPILVITHLV